MAGIFDEANMRQVLGACIPEGENLAAGIHGITLQVNQKKTSYFDVYVGVTEHFLLVAECEERKYLTAAPCFRICGKPSRRTWARASPLKASRTASLKKA